MKVKKIGLSGLECSSWLIHAFSALLESIHETELISNDS